MQQILFPPESSWKPPNISDLPSWKNAKRVGIDTETKDPSLKRLGPGVRRDGRMVGISFAIEDGPAHYLPFGHAIGQQLPKDSVLDYVRRQAAEFTGTVVFANASYDLDYLAEAGITFPKAQWIRDVQVADPLIYELHLKYSLDAIAERHGCPLKVEGKLREAAEAWHVDPKTDLWKLDPCFCGEYAEADARNPLLILRRQENEIDTVGLWEIYNIESKVTPILVEMRRHGIKIDFAKLYTIKAWCEEEIARCLAEVHRLTGRHIDRTDLTLPAALAKVFQSVGVLPSKTSKGQFNIDKEFLAACGHPVGSSIARARKVQKLTDTFANSVIEHATNGRLHPTFNQLKKSKDQDDSGDNTEGAAYGRLSASNPNIQQQPARDDFAKMWRSIYLPDDGKVWCCNDYSQQEPRILTHYAALCQCPGARTAAEKYHADPMMDSYTLITNITGLGEKYGAKKGRDYSKVICLALSYGMGGAKTARSLGLPTARKQLDDGKIIDIAGPEAQGILDAFNNNAPYIKSLAKLTERKAKNTGIIRTLLGRHCHFPMKEMGGYDWAHKALNRLIQGSAADQTKAALVQATEAGFRIQLQVHDELDLSVKDKEEGLALAEIMKKAVPLLVPMRVDCEIGASWGEIA